MGFSSDKSQDGTWVISGVHLRSPLRPIYTAVAAAAERDFRDGDDDVHGCPTTPKSEESRISEKLPCPPPPRKRRAVLKRKCNGGGVREFFTPPDLDTVFVRRVQRAG